MAKFKVLLTDYAWPDLEIEQALLALYDAELVVAPATDAATLAGLAADADAIMTNWVEVRGRGDRRGREVRIHLAAGHRTRQHRRARATERGIPVTNVPDYCLIEVAEHALATVLALARKLHVYPGRRTGGPVRSRGRTAAAADRGARRSASSASGRSAGCWPQKARGHRASSDRRPAVRASRRSPACSRLRAGRLLATSDYVSLHVPLNAETRQLIDAPGARQNEADGVSHQHVAGRPGRPRGAR